MDRKPGQMDREDDVRNGVDLGDEDKNSSNRSEEDQTKGHGPLKGTDTLATTDAECIEREKGKRTTM
jgi:hypothetical protein